MALDAWVICKSCGLKHRSRTDGICPRCGYDNSSPQQTSTPAAPLVTASPKKGNFDWRTTSRTPDEKKLPVVGPLVAGLIAAIIMGAICGELTNLNYNLVAAFFAVGPVIGFFIYMLGGRGDSARLIALTCVLAAFITSKALFMMNHTPFEHAALQSINNNKALIVPALYDLAAQREIPVDVAQQLAGLRLNASKGQFLEVVVPLVKHQDQAIEHIRTMSPQLRVNLVLNYLDAVFRGLAPWERMTQIVSLDDGIWFCLALVLAFRIAGRGREEEPKPLPSQALPISMQSSSPREPT